MTQSPHGSRNKLPIVGSKGTKMTDEFEGTRNQKEEDSIAEDDDSFMDWETR